MNCPNCGTSSYRELSGVVNCEGARAYVRCTCGATYETFAATNKTVAKCSCGLRYTSQKWIALPLVGQQDDLDGGFLELRNCSCGSTIASAVCYSLPK